jgi:hypothetical protein
MVPTVTTAATNVAVDWKRKAFQFLWKEGLSENLNQLVVDNSRNPEWDEEEIRSISRLVIAAWGILLSGFAIVAEEMGIHLGWVHLIAGIMIGAAAAPLWNVAMWDNASDAGSIHAILDTVRGAHNVQAVEATPPPATSTIQFLATPVASSMPSPRFRFTAPDPDGFSFAFTTPDAHTDAAEDDDNAPQEADDGPLADVPRQVDSGWTDKAESENVPVVQKEIERGNREILRVQEMGNNRPFNMIQNIRPDTPNPIVRKYGRFRRFSVSPRP